MEQLQCFFILDTHDYIDLGLWPDRHSHAFTISSFSWEKHTFSSVISVLTGIYFLKADMQQKKEPVQDDSDLDRKRRETEALLQSIGISPEPPLGT